MFKRLVVCLSISISCLGADTGAQENKYLTNDSLSITEYNPIYFAYGNPSTKLQLSFKYKMFHWMPLYFGYTQILFWNLSKDSLPFKDVNYGPDLFYRFEIKESKFESIDLAPYSHLSNGQEGVASRTLNRAFVRTTFKMPVREGYLKLAVTIFGLYDLSVDNSDIYQYISPLELKLKFTQFVPWIFDRGELSFRVFPGGSFAERWDRGGQELGLSFRVGGLGMNSSIFVQYYNGYAESLLDYNKHESALRIGVVL